MANNRFKWQVRPVASDKNILSGKCYRITALTPNLIRFEYSSDGIFENRASQTVFYRDFPETPFTVSKENGVLTFETDAVRIIYRENEQLSADTLSFKLKDEPASQWNYGDDYEDLGGTARTLDRTNGSIPLGRGVCSRNGFSVLDDSRSMLLNDDGWVEVRRPDTTDFYFFGYGFRYLDAVKDFYRLTGIPPMLPDYALGNWWSRYHAYTQQEYTELIERFKSEDVPFSVSVIDMDWHITKIPEDKQYKEQPRLCSGWTGYSWNKELFPDYKEFLKYLHDNGLKTTLNLHPAVGVCRHEDMYEQMAKECGIDSSTGERVKLDILDPDFMEKYFDILHHPYENDGVDFWWMDWQQGTDYWWIHEPNSDGKLHDEREVLDPLWMLNHLHILDISHSGKRPMFFSRYSGPGSQRYPVGFSGDTHVTWDSLNFQPYFTLTASNIGYSWWSHDIGGHMGGYRDEDLTVRWMQLGVFSPINRLHSSSGEFIRKEPWMYDSKHSEIIKSLLRLRHCLFPYIYTMNYRTHSELEPLVQPIYYLYPKSSLAYEVKNQYFFGSELMVAPITEPTNKTDNLGGADLFLPKGDWFDFVDGTHYFSKRGRKMRVYRDIGHYPVFAKAGAIVPLQAHTEGSNKLGNAKETVFCVFAGASNSFTVYEDAGDGIGFEKGEYVKTKAELIYGEKSTFSIYPSEGKLDIVPFERIRRVKFRGFSKGIDISAYVGTNKAPVDVKYDQSTYTYEVTVTASISEKVTFELTGNVSVHNNENAMNKCLDILMRANTSTRRKNNMWKAVNENTDIHGKLCSANYEVSDTESQHIVDALREQLTLTRGEFEE